MMDCRDFQELLKRRLDGEAAVRTLDMNRHVAGCTACRELEVAASRLVDGLKALSETEPPVGFSAHMTALVLKDRQARRRRLKTRLLITVALAASVLVIVVAGNLLGPRMPSSGKSPHPLAYKVEKPNDSPPLTVSMDKARTAVLSLSQRWAEEAKEQGRIIVSAANTLGSSDMITPEPLDFKPAARSLQNAGESMVVAVSPVTTTTRQAFAYFVGELPVLEEKN